MRVVAQHHGQPSETRNDRATVSVVVADDCLIYRKGLTALLNAHPDLHVVGEAASHGELLADIRALVPDILIFDYSLIAPRSRAAPPLSVPTQPGMRSVMIVSRPLTRHEGLQLLERFAGLSGFVPRHVSDEDLVSAVRVVHSGGTWTGPDHHGLRPLPLATDERFEQPLTRRHMQVACLVARGCSNKEIASTLGISDATVKKHIRALLERLCLKDRLQIALYVTRHTELFPDTLDSPLAHQES